MVVWIKNANREANGMKGRIEFIDGMVMAFDHAENEKKVHAALSCLLEAYTGVPAEKDELGVYSDFWTTTVVQENNGRVVLEFGQKNASDTLIQREKEENES